MKFKPLHTLSITLTAGLLYACASIGSPDGGPYDETPPKFVRSTPEPNALNNKRNKVTIEFDEFIKLEKASEKVIISPPQNEMPEVQANGKHIKVEFYDTLQANTTYVIDFGDAIVDNNEGNPMGNFAYAFSTGDIIDTMQVAGTVLNAADLEPVKGIQVGIHQNLNDSAFTKLPFDRISRTDSRGKFIIRGIKPGKYRIYALKDGNQNFLYDSKSEAIAFLDSLVIPDKEDGAIRYDTVWNKVDTLKYDTIYKTSYTRFLPDDLILRAFKEENNLQYLVKSEREQINRFSLYFNAKADTLPTLKGLDFDEKDAFIIEATPKNDTIRYWIKDSLMCERDTLTFQLGYLATDTLGQLVPRVDTLLMANKINKERRMVLEKEERKKKEKELKKRRRRDSLFVEQPKFFEMKVNAPANFDLNQNITLSFEEPMASIDTAGIHIQMKVDTLWEEKPFIFMSDTVLPRKYAILSDWQPGEEYQLVIDSLAIRSIYGQATNKVQSKMKIKNLEDYGTLYLNIIGADEHAIVQLLNSNDAVIRQQPVSKKSTCDFYFLQPDTKYYIRLINDRNNNGKWDTGIYEEKLQPEEVFYFPKVWEIKANFEFEETWNLKETPLDKQKLDELKKQKPEESKKIIERNKERARKLGKNNPQ